jgi:hypothetical protein
VLPPPPEAAPHSPRAAGEAGLFVSAAATLPVKGRGQRAKTRACVVRVEGPVQQVHD